MRSAVVGLLMCLACSGGSTDLTDPPSGNPPPGTPPPASGPGIVASLVVTEGADQVATVGTELAQAIVVHVADAKADAVPNQLINFVVTKGGGSVFAGAAQSNSAGEARERWTLGPAAGPQTLEARAVDQTTGAPIVFATITATAEPGPVTSLTLSAPPARLFTKQALDLATLVTAATDAFGNVVPAPALAVTAEQGVTVQGTTVSSDAERATTVQLTSGAAAAPVTLNIVRDLHELVGGTGAFTCGGSPINVLIGDDASPTRVTSIRTTLTVDSVSYADEATLWSSEVITFTPEAGVPRDVGPVVVDLQVGAQQPGRWFLVGGDWLELIRESPLNYSGPPPCGHWHFGQAVNSDMVIGQ